jgi:polyisoprenoid-binding protein YceI
MKTIEVPVKTKWSIDQAHSEISFRVRHLMIAHVNGMFKRFDASIYTSGEDFSTAEIDLWIDASSITTGEDLRDKHLRSGEFLDARRYKQLTFTSSTMGLANQDGNHELWGELTILGITKNVMLNVSFGGIINDPWGNERSGFMITGKINRSEWGLTWNSSTEPGVVMVSDEVSIFCEFELVNTGKKCLIMDLE